MKYKLYTTSQTAWAGMFEAMIQAQYSIYLEMYIFLDDTQATYNFLRLLREKAQAGLEVIVIADSFGSASLAKKAVEGLRTAGVEFIYFSHWFRHTHRKILIIDNKIAFTGGVNIEEKTRSWRDIQIRLQGKIVSPLLKSFAYSYEMAGGKRASILKFSQKPLVQKIKSWIIDNFARTSKSYYLNDYYKQRIINAKTSIIIVTPYLLPPRWLIALLDNATHRGVKVEILIPDDTDVKSLNRVNYLNARHLSSLGIKVYLMSRMNHAKIMLIDGVEGVIGSQNMDVLSFNWNIEVGIFFRQKDLVNDLEKIIIQWRAGSVALDINKKKVEVIDRILILILKLFYTIF